MKRCGFTSRTIKMIALLMSFVMMFVVVVPVRATTISDLENQKKELEEQKKVEEQKKKDEQKKYDDAAGRADAIGDEVDALEEEIAEVDEELVLTLASIEIIHGEIEDKETQIEITSEQLELAIATETEQYESMKIRIRYLYEKGDETYLQLILASKSLGEAMNKVEYIEKIYDYDRTLLEEYQEARRVTQELKDQLEEEKAELEAQQHELEEEQAYLEEILAEKEALYDDYSLQLTKAQEEAAIYKANIKKQNDAIRDLEKKSKDKQAEIDAAKKAEEEARKAQEEALRVQGSSSGSGKTYASPGSFGGSLGNQIANYACQFIGNPYVPGGTSLTQGADCSGFVWRIYKDFGYSVPRTSYSLRNVGREVSYSEAQPGDIICYAGHVAIYIGNGQIVHASTQRTGIKITHATYKEMITIRRVV